MNKEYLMKIWKKTKYCEEALLFAYIIIKMLKYK